jgi:RHS repeat-associated protein
MPFSTATLLATDLQRSVLHMLDVQGRQPRAYTSYGHYPADSGLSGLFGFNGEQRDPLTGHYLLGNGYRAFNPVLMRFNSPDSLSPFGKGGLNAYAYCVGDPVNWGDPTGHIGDFLKSGLRRLGVINKPSAKNLLGRLSLSLDSEQQMLRDELNILYAQQQEATPHLKSAQRHLELIDSEKNKLETKKAPIPLYLERTKSRLQERIAGLSTRSPDLEMQIRDLEKRLPPPEYDAPPSYASIVKNIRK